MMNVYLADGEIVFSNACPPGAVVLPVAYDSLSDDQKSCPSWDAVKKIIVVNKQAVQKRDAAIAAEKSKTARADRNRKLLESDWTQLPDSPVDKTAWAAYRQKLRDIPQQAGFPDAVTWPEAPV